MKKISNFKKHDYFGLIIIILEFLLSIRHLLLFIYHF